MHEPTVLIVRRADCAAPAQTETLATCCDDDPRIQGLVLACDLHGILRYFTDIFDSTLLLDSSCVRNTPYTDTPPTSLRLQFTSNQCAQEAMALFTDVGCDVFRDEPLSEWFLKKRLTYKATLNDIAAFVKQPAPDMVADTSWRNEKQTMGVYGQVPWCCFLSKV